MTIDVDDVATDADLETYTLGRDRLQALLPEDAAWAGDDGYKTAQPAREEALRNVLRVLKNRRPPILDVDLVDVTELRTAVTYGALEIIYIGAIEHEDSPNAKKAKRFGDLYRAEIQGLQPTIALGLAASPMTIRVSRG